MRPRIFTTISSDQSMIQHSPIMKQEKNNRVYFFTMAYNILRIMELLIYFKDGMKILVRCNIALQGESTMNKSSPIFKQQVTPLT